jgi:hypothetical protein
MRKAENRVDAGGERKYGIIMKFRGMKFPGISRHNALETIPSERRPSERMANIDYAITLEDQQSAWSSLVSTHLFRLILFPKKKFSQKVPNSFLNFLIVSYPIRVFFGLSVSVWRVIRV